MNGHVLVDQLAKTYDVRTRKGLFKSEHKQVPALKGVSLEIQPGEVFGLLGPNGAGKTTLIKCLTTLLLPSAGRAVINGFELTHDDNAIRATTGCMLMGERGLYWKLTARENLVFFGALYHLSPSERKRRADVLIDQLGLGEIADRALESYSSGQRMKVAFAKALVNDAPLLILDEPTNTLDVPSARELRAMVRRLNEQGKTVIYTTHIMAEAETLCDRVAIIDRGEVLATGSVPDLKASLDRDAVLKIEGVIPSAASQAVARLGGVTQSAIQAIDGRTQLTVMTHNANILLPSLIETLTRHAAIIQKIAPEEVTLEDVFIARTGRTLAEDTRA
jgi:ABC-2 type transport system ATP-binding protein